MDRRVPIEDGYTLVELLVTVAIMGVAVVGLVGSLFSVLVFSDADRRGALVEGDTRRFAELVRSATYEECADPTDPAKNSYEYTETYQNDPSLTRGVLDVEFWDNASETFETYAASDCSLEAPKDPGIQRVTVRVTSTGSVAITRELTIVKRRGG